MTNLVCNNKARSEFDMKIKHVAIIMQGRAEANPNSFCSGSCVATIMDFYADCSGAAADGVRQLLQTGKYSYNS